MLKLFFLTGFKRPRPVDSATHIFKDGGDGENDGFAENVANGLFLKKVQKVLFAAAHLGMLLRSTTLLNSKSLNCIE